MRLLDTKGMSLVLVQSDKRGTTLFQGMRVNYALDKK